MLTPRYSITFAVALQASALASAETLNEKVWSVFAYTLHGDTIPEALPQSSTLTTYGASGLYSAGSAFRSRYVAVHPGDSYPSTRIQNISPYALETEEVDVLSAADQSVVASAQAFMQGLYPPLGQSYNATYVEPSSLLANGSLASAPLNGYQYPQITAPSSADPLSVQVAGQHECLMHQAADYEYRASLEVQEITQVSEAFYMRLYDQALSGVFERSAATYKNAQSISQFLEYQAVHNETLLHSINQEDIDRARWYADQYIYATNGNKISSGPIANASIRTVAGQTLAPRILNAFKNNINNRGNGEKLSLVFGSSEPVVALASLMQLSSPKNGNFQSRLAAGASIVLELFSLEDEANPTYPDPSQLWVRFLLHNGTDDSTDFRSYALFGHGPSKVDIHYSEFEAEMENISMRSAEDWCLKCNSRAVFCSGLFSEHHNQPASKKGISPAVGGVIGAVVTLVVLALAAVIGFLIYGFRTNRWRKPSLGGFKGNGKMASDSDITFKNPIWGDVKVAEGQRPDENEAGGTIVRGNERSGSWEMRQQGQRNRGNPNGAQQNNPFQDEVEEEWRLHSLMQPVRVRESV
ncbi:hypothetical protein ASPWEDRAFT_443121 [Aspergillus wentii DTO 134E9]|uniref:Histidine acid phosphatase n=1 Tax=Aspergillus wentii DTO 134E9 TaxID=1073089 RepID=A0A1L9RQU2_ASPWE|nr:uncharacterized protein ASPWEDRAFT_443121 [Aspergillus wentii DTO 134E9]KAI9928319.1 hypothetical protein MW887_002357 [Aspergillus wentii]OJJ37198.1 hypothetical protein ASPWEDRAFT_443121 [Aspergillus wentii DTO 134E9]